jgi:hypothetical protein
MAQKPLPTAAQIAEEKMPGWKAVESKGPIRDFGATAHAMASSDAPDVPPKVDAVLPTTKQLRRKFLGEDAADAADEDQAKPLEPDVELVDMKSGDLERTVGVNRRSQKIEWSQG